MELLADTTKCVLWITDSPVENQLYISETYQKIWGRSIVSLYQKPYDWVTFLSEKNPYSVLEELVTRNTKKNPSHSKIYSFYLPDGKIQLCIDRSFRLENIAGENGIMCGVAMPVSEKQISDSADDINDRLDKIVLDFYSILNINAQPNLQPNNHIVEKINDLTNRERDIYKLVLLGLTAKQISVELHLSKRTIENYTNTIKEKLGYSNKSEMILSAIENNLLQVFL